jgi:sec-independent protein translocase protein TatC
LHLIASANPSGTFAASVGTAPPPRPKPMPLFKQRPRDYPDDIFADTRMSFGDHIEELRTYLVRALLGVLAVMFGGLALDGVGYSVGTKSIGFARPLLELINAPAEAQVRAFYIRRQLKAQDVLPGTFADREQVAGVKGLLDWYDQDTSRLREADRRTLLAAPEPLPVRLPVKELAEALGVTPKPGGPEFVVVRAEVQPAHVSHLAGKGEGYLGLRQFIRTQNPQEGMVIYFKVAFVASLVLAAPWVFYNLWAFVAAGLYPHERGYVYRMLGPSTGLFLLGVLVCQFVVLPGAVKALIGFNDYVELDPDLRMTEWLNFALLLPLVFGVSFQTPLVMVFLNRMGTFGWQDYWSKWRYAVVVLAVFAALITPTPDAVTMLYLFVPMFGLYLLGVAICYFFPPAHEETWDRADDQIAV